MPRINLEDQFFLDLADVAVKMGDADKAAGQAIRWIRFAQAKFQAGERITRAEFNERFSDALIPTFARADGDHVRVAGEQKFFGWLQKRREAGSKGGSAPRAPDGSKPEQTEAKASKPEQTEASSSYSSSSSNSVVGEDARAPAREGPAAAVKASPAGGRVQSVSELHARLPQATREALIEGCRRYGGCTFFEAAVLNAFTYHSARPESATWHISAWVSKINAAIEHAKLKAPAPFISTPTPTQPRAAPAQIEIKPLSADEILCSAAAAKRLGLRSDLVELCENQARGAS